MFVRAVVAVVAAVAEVAAAVVVMQDVSSEFIQFPRGFATY